MFLNVTYFYCSIYASTIIHEMRNYRKITFILCPPKLILSLFFELFMLTFYESANYTKKPHVLLTPQPVTPHCQAKIF